jgi:chemotaxis protein CheX
MDQTSNAEEKRVTIHLSARATGPGSRAAGRASGAAPSITHDGWRDDLAKATCEVFEIMVGTSLGDATAESLPFVADVAAMVGLAGSLCGVVGLHSSSECARKMAGRMLGGDEVGSSENVQDAFGEVCNMIAGAFKARIAGLADGCALSVPTVIIGRDFALYSLANGEHHEVTFSFEGKPLSVTLDVHS